MAEARAWDDAAEARLRLLAEQLPAAVWTTDADLRFTSAYGAALDLLGLQPNDLLGRSVVEMAEPGQGQAVTAHRRALEGESGTYESTYLERAFQAYVAPLRGTEGDVVGVMGIALDITDRKRTEEADRYHRSLLQSQTEALLDGILVVDSDGRMVSFNRRFVEMWHIPDEVVASRSDEAAIDSVLHQLVNPAAFTERVAYLYSHPEEESRDEILLRDGRLFHRYSAPVRGEDGTYYGRVWFFSDITAQRNAEEELRYRTSLLEAQEEATIDGVLVVSPDGSVVSCNRRLVDMWDVPQNALDSGKGDEIFGALIERAADRVAADALFVRLRADQSEHVRRELRLVDDRTIDCYSAPIQPPDGPFYGRLWTFRDITERVRHEQVVGFLAAAGELLASSLDYRTTLLRVARLSVAALADWCIVYMLEEDGSISRIAIEHADPETRAFLRSIQDRFRLDPQAEGGVPEVIRTGRSRFEPTASIEHLVEDVDDPPGLAEVIATLRPVSWICVPLAARGRTFGAISFLTADSGRRYDETDLRQAQELARRAALAVDNARLYEQRKREADHLRRSLLPPALPAIPGLDLAARFRAFGEGTEVGGDFYDIFPSGEGWAAVIGDVCGRGIEAAAITGLVRHTMRGVGLSERRPSRVLRMVNKALFDQIPEHSFCTACYVFLHRSGSGLSAEVSAGGHPLPLAIRADGSVEPIGRPGTLLGTYPEPDLTDRSVELAPGEALLLYTDGVTDVHRDTEIFGEERLAEVLQASAGRSADGMARAVEEAVTEFHPGSLRDDMAVLVIRVMGE